MGQTFDVIVIGLGGMGTATCQQLAQRGEQVLGLEQFELGHALGSSHGQTRLIRQAYFEETRYVPLLKRAYALWDETSKLAERQLFHRAGLLIVAAGNQGSSLAGVKAAASAHAIPIEILSDTELRREYPQFQPGKDAAGIFEPGAGYLEVENAVRAQALLAERAGAHLHFKETVKSWSAAAHSVTVVTERETYRAARLVITAGAWAGRLLKDLGLPLQVRRVPQFWFPAVAQPRGPRPMPCFAFDRPEAFIYGFPDQGAGLKIADYHPPSEIVTDPANVDRVIRESDLGRIQACISAGLPGVSSQPSAATVCLYTMTPDTHFIVDVHPNHQQVAYAAGFSGHGFKFACVIGEVLADLSQRGSTTQPIDFLRWRKERAAL